MKKNNNPETSDDCEAPRHLMARFLRLLGCVPLGAVDQGRDDRTIERPSGYYVDGRDWPPFSSSIPLADVYRALGSLDDAAVKAALDTLQAVEVPPEN